MKIYRTQGRPSTPLSDLSRRAAQGIGMTGSGIARVRVSILGRS